MIDAKTEVSTRELCSIADLTKGRLSQLETGGIIRRVDRDRWRLVETMQALLKDASERSDKHSAQRAKLDELRAAREELKLRRECNDLVRLSEFKTAIDAVAFCVLRHLDPLPARIGGRDLELRRRCESEIRAAQAGMSADMQAQADSLKDTGRAA